MLPRRRAIDKGRKCWHEHYLGAVLLPDAAQNRYLSAQSRNIGFCRRIFCFGFLLCTQMARQRRLAVVFAAGADGGYKTFIAALFGLPCVISGNLFVRLVIVIIAPK